jgi:hypothetical protein
MDRRIIQYKIHYYSMYIKGISHTREIIWPNVTRHFEGATPEFLCKLFFDLVQQCNIDMDNIAGNMNYYF